jgi:DNA-binding transcriptional ArsR family regulator
MGEIEREKQRDPGRFAYQGLERVIHEKARLGILASLVANNEGLLFTELKELCALTDGNLSRHLRVLSDAGLVEVWKGFRGNHPQTLVRMTSTGREKFLDYIGVLEQVIADTAEASSITRQTTARHDRRGWSPA